MKKFLLFLCFIPMTALSAEKSSVTLLQAVKTENIQAFHKRMRELLKNETLQGLIQEVSLTDSAGQNIFHLIPQVKDRIKAHKFAVVADNYMDLVSFSPELKLSYTLSGVRISVHKGLQSSSIHALLNEVIRSDRSVLNFIEYIMGHPAIEALSVLRGTTFSALEVEISALKSTTKSRMSIYDYLTEVGSVSPYVLAVRDNLSAYLHAPYRALDQNGLSPMDIAEQRGGPVLKVYQERASIINTPLPQDESVVADVPPQQEQGVQRPLPEESVAVAETGTDGSKMETGSLPQEESVAVDGVLPQSEQGGSLPEFHIDALKDSQQEQRVQGSLPQEESVAVDGVPSQQEQRVQSPLEESVAVAETGVSGDKASLLNRVREVISSRAQELEVLHVADLARQAGITTMEEYKKRAESLGLPLDPEEVFKDSWENWDRFLSASSEDNVSIFGRSALGAVLGAGAILTLPDPGLVESAVVIGGAGYAPVTGQVEGRLTNKLKGMCQTYFQKRREKKGDRARALENSGNKKRFSNSAVKGIEGNG